ncbi:hypothetical protein ABK040_009242 [Willaertia magna]
MSNVEKLPGIVEFIQSNDSNTQLNGVIELRKLLSVVEKPPIDEVLQSGVLPTLVQFLYNDYNPLLQFESLWAIANITAGQSFHTEAVIRANATPIIIKLLNSPFDYVVEQSIWVLGNIAGDSHMCRDYVLQMGVMPLLLNIINKLPKTSTLRNATWTLSNLFRGKPIPYTSLVNEALPTLTQLLLSSDDEEVISDVAWSFSYYSDGPNSRVQEVINCSGVCERLAQLLTHQNYKIVTPVLRTIGNITTGDNVQTQIIVNDTVLNGLLQLLSYSKVAIRKEACWSISNIVAGGNRQQIQSVIDAKIMPKIVSIISDEKEDINVIKEAVWVLNNLFDFGSKDQINFIIRNLECILPIVNLLDNCKDLKLLSVILGAINYLLSSGNDFRDNQSCVNPYIECIECCDGFEKVRLYSNHNDTSIVTIVNDILQYKNAMDLN